MLTNDEIDLILNSLDAYESIQERDVYSRITNVVVGFPVLMQPDAAEKMKAEAEKRMADARVEMRNIKDRNVMLKARLISMKEKNIASEAGEFLKGGTDKSEK